MARRLVPLAPFGKMLVFALVAIAAARGRAEEVDNFFADKSSYPPAANEALNKIVNQRLQHFTELFNNEKLGRCEWDGEEGINRKIFYFLDQNYSAIGNELRDRSDKSFGDIKFMGPSSNPNSIYDGADVPCCVQSLNVNGTLIGLDKIDHFFGNGGILKTKYDAGIKDDATLMQLNVAQEHGIWGLKDMGVKSYGDLAANWQGLKFYRELFEGKNPYYKCEKGVMTQVRQFKIEDYFNRAWSESTNCSAFVSTEIAAKVAENVKARGLKCPMNADDCAEMNRIYKDDPLAAENLISPVCSKGIAYEKSVEKAASRSWDDLKNAVGGVRLKDAAKFLGFGGQK